MTTVKKILFLHPNFPGQFKNLAIFLGRQEHFDVKFLCLTNFGNSIKGVNPLVIKGDRSQSSMDDQAKTEFEKMLFRAESYRRTFLMLKKNNWNPDVVIGHTGWGCGIHVKETWPKTKFFGYAEWWFEAYSELRTEMKSNKYLGISVDNQSKLWHRNRIIGYELCTSDTIIAPSQWQKQQLPTGLQKNCIIIADGVDIDYFAEKTAELNEFPLVTYGTRGMEPMRCFKEFINSLPPLLEKYPDLEVQIAGEDKICYGGYNPSSNTTWGTWAKKYLASGKYQKRVNWLGNLKYDEYKQWLQKSWCHVYLSQPFVCSWSLLEAIACGNIIVASNTPPVNEYCKNLKGVLLTNHEEPINIAKNVAFALKKAKKISKKDLRDARQDLLDDLALRRCLDRWLDVTGLDPNTCH